MKELDGAGRASKPNDGMASPDLPSDANGASDPVYQPCGCVIDRDDPGKTLLCPEAIVLFFHHAAAEIADKRSHYVLGSDRELSAYLEHFPPEFRDDRRRSITSRPQNVHCDKRRPRITTPITFNASPRSNRSKFVVRPGMEPTLQGSPQPVLEAGNHLSPSWPGLTTTFERDREAIR